MVTLDKGTSGNNDAPPTVQPAATTAESSFSVGSILSRTFATLMKNPAVFFGLAIIAILPSTIVEALSPEQRSLGFVMQVVETILSLAVQGAIAYTVYCVLTGKSTSLGDSVSRGMARIGPLLLAAILTGLGIGIGMLLLVIPGIIVMCVWAVTIPACVVEKLGPLESINRSTELTRGYRMPIFGLLLITGLLGVGFIIGAATQSVMAATLVAAPFVAAIQAFNCVMVAIIYYDLRAIKEGVTLDSLANVFD